jgi:hypothetical protein
MDLCGPYSVQTLDGKQHFYVILDDHSNFGFLHLLHLKNEVFPAYCCTEAFIKQSCSKLIITVHVAGALELTQGNLAKHFSKHGIVVQQTTAYAHQQASKIEHYVWTIEEGGQTLIANSGLPMSFWGQYLCNRLSTTTLTSNTTPFEVFTTKSLIFHIFVSGVVSAFQLFPQNFRQKLVLEDTRLYSLATRKLG